MNSETGETSMNLIQVYDDGWRHALVAKEGSKWLHIIVLNSSGLRVEKLPLDEEEEVMELGDASRGQIQRFLDFGERCGMTETARRALMAGLAGEQIDDVEADENEPAY